MAPDPTATLAAPRAPAPTLPTARPAAAWVAESDVDDPSLYEEASEPFEILATPLAAAPFRHRRLAMVTPHVTAYLEAFDAPVRVQGLSPADTLLVVVPIRNAPRTSYWPTPPRAKGFPGMLPGSFDVLMDAGQFHAVVLIDRARFAQLLSPRAVAALERAAARRVFPADPAAVAGLGDWLHKTLEAARERPEVVHEAASVAAFEDALLARLERALDAKAPRDRPASWAARHRGLDRALDHLHRGEGAVSSVPELCGAAGVAQRSLELAFRERMAMTPLQYLRKLRLHEARRCLLADDRGRATVAQVAVLHGFRHKGRFAAAYRAEFGETPLATLRRRSQTAPRTSGLRPPRAP